MSSAVAEMTAPVGKGITAEEAAVRPPDGRWELIRGEVVTYMPVQAEHADCVQAVTMLVGAHVGDRSKALMGPEIGFIVARNPDTVRAPDWSLTWREDAVARRRGAWIEGGPLFAVEVISPDDTWHDVQEKVDEYLAAGTALVWVIDPTKRTLHVYRPDVPMAVLHAADTVTAAPVLPELTIPVAALLGPEQAAGA